MSPYIILPGPHAEIPDGAAVRIGSRCYTVVSSRRGGGSTIVRIRAAGDGREEGGAITLDPATPIHRTPPMALSLRRFTLMTLVGLLPASRQKILAEKWEFDPADSTLYSALLEVLLAFPLFLHETILHVAGRSNMPAPTWLLLGCVFLEGALRASAALFLNESLGIVPLAIFRVSRPTGGSVELYGDLVTVKERELLLTTHFPKPHLRSAPAIRYDGRCYIFVDARRIHYSTLLRFAETIEREDALPLDLERERQGNRAAERSFIYSPLWGFLPGTMQRRLEEAGHFRACRATLFSLSCLLFIAIPIPISDLARLALVGPDWIMAIRMPIALYFIHESIMRLIRLVKDREPSGSLLGRLLMPVARRALKPLLT